MPAMRSEGIPINTQPYYKNLGFLVGDFPFSELYSKEAISISMFFTLSIEQQDFVVASFKNFFFPDKNLKEKI
jgi:dTDP-4-amino-4,6-dideoxygalactose transaminase